MFKQELKRIIGVLLFIALAGCSEEKPEMKQIIRPVRCMAVYMTGGEQTREFSGAAKSGLESNLSFRVAGTLTKIHVKVGDEVKKGDMIATLDPKDYRLQVQDTEAALAQAKALALNAESNYKRIRGLYENGNTSKSDLDSARASFESARASAKSIEKKLELARRQTGYTKLRAPFAGAISRVPVHENENLNAGTPVAVLMSKSKPEVSVAIPEVLISGIRQGDAVTVQFDALPGKEYAGKITEVGVASSDFATTYPVTVTLKKTGTPVRPGMTATVRFLFASGNGERFVVPPHTVSEDRNGRYVFIALPEKDGLAAVKRVAVTVGAPVSEGLEVLDGLSDGDLLITAGMSRLRDGMKVKLPAGKEG